jgi:glycosyltransferase involved in cell wall biosynthesis
MKKVLMMVYYFPPSGVAGVHRETKYVKYMQNYGWSPYVLTVKEWIENQYDYSLLEEVPDNVKVIRTGQLGIKLLSTLFSYFRSLYFKSLLSSEASTIEPQKKQSNKKTQHSMLNPSHHFISRLYKFLLPIPDFQIILWLPICVISGLRIIKKEKIDVIYASGQPFSSFIAGYILKKITGKPLVLDYHDRWTQNRYFNPPTNIHRKIHEFLEHTVLQTADKVTIVVEQFIDGLVNKFHVDRDKIRFIPNGFDSEDFQGISVIKGDKLTITYLGSLYGDMKLDYFFRAIRELLDDYPELEKQIKINFISKFDESNYLLIEKFRLANVIEIKGFVEHKKALQFMLNSHIIFLIVPTTSGYKFVYTTKIFEYIASGVPILGLVHPQGVAAELIKRTRTGVVVDSEDVEAIKEAIIDFYRRYKENKLVIEPDRDEIRKYDRKELTKKLAEFFDEVCQDQN